MTFDGITGKKMSSYQDGEPKKTKKINMHIKHPNKCVKCALTVVVIIKAGECKRFSFATESESKFMEKMAAISMVCVLLLPMCLFVR